MHDTAGAEQVLHRSPVDPQLAALDLVDIDDAGMYQHLPGPGRAGLEVVDDGHALCHGRGDMARLVGSLAGHVSFQDHRGPVGEWAGVDGAARVDLVERRRHIGRRGMLRRHPILDEPDEVADILGVGAGHGFRLLLLRR